MLTKMSTADLAIVQLIVDSYARYDLPMTAMDAMFGALVTLDDDDVKKKWIRLCQSHFGLYQAALTLYG